MATWKQGDFKKVGFAIKRPDYMATVQWPVIFVKIGERGYWEASTAEDIPEEIAESALAGSLFGWSCPAAQPAIEYAKNL